MKRFILIATCMLTLALAAACTPSGSASSGVLPATQHHQRTPADSGGGLPPKGP